MNKMYPFQSDEEGMVLITCMLALFVLSLAGMMAMNTATMETQVAGNMKSYAVNFYRAEAAVREMAKGIDNTPDSTLVNDTKIRLPDNQDLASALTGVTGLTTPDSLINLRLNLVNNAESNIDVTEPLFNCKVKVLHTGPASGESLSIGTSHHASSKHRFSIFARSKPASILGRGVVIEVGYLKKLRL